MKKLLLLPVFLFSYYYPFNFQFQFVHSCMQQSTLPYKYQYCRCLLNKLENRFSYNFFIYNSSSKEVLDFLKKASKECIK